MEGVVYGKKVFILNSYSPQDVCGAPQYKGVLKALKENILNDLQIESYFLDSKRLSKRDVKRHIAEAVKRIKRFHPDLLITVDDLAFTVGLKYFLNADFPIVFSGVNRPLKEYNKEYHLFNSEGFPLKKVVGVYEKLFIKEQIEFLQMLFGKKEFKVAVVYSTDFIGTILKNQLVDEVKGTPFEEYFVFYPVAAFKEVKAAVEAIKKNKSILAYFPFVTSVWDEEKKEYLDPGRVAPYLISHLCLLDLFPNSAGAKKLGYFGGVAIDFFAMGYQAGIMGVKLLQGYKPSDIKVENAQKYVILINKRRLKPCGISISPTLLNLVDEVIQ